MRRISLFLVLYLLVLAAPVEAASYYVNNSGSPSCGNNPPPANGSLSAPFCTIAYGISQMASGDTLNVQAGIYTDPIDITGPAGTASQHTIIRTYPTGTLSDNVIINNLNGGGTAHGRVKIEWTASYLEFVGFRVTNWNQGIFIEASNVILKNCQVDNVGVEGIHVHNSGSGDPTNWTIDSCIVHDTGKLGVTGEGIYIGTGSSGPTLDNTNNGIIKNSTIFNTLDEGIELKCGTHDVTVDHDDVSQTNTGGNGAGGGAIAADNSICGVEVWNSNPNHIIRNNKIHDTGIGSGGQADNSAIELSTGATVYNNVIWNVNTAGGGVGILADNGNGYVAPYTRVVYHNTVDEPSARAILNAGSGFSIDSQNNIGPFTSGNNLATNAAFYVNQTAHDYHLVARAAPIGAGANLTATVPLDADGNTRPVPPSIGAYEYSAGSPPAPPSNLRVTVQ